MSKERGIVELVLTEECKLDGWYNTSPAREGDSGSWSPGAETFLERDKLYLGRLILLMGVRCIPSAFGGTPLLAPIGATAPLHHANNLGIHSSLPQSVYD